MSTPGLTGSPAPCDFAALAKDLAATGYVIVPDFLRRETGEALVSEIATLWHDGTYRAAAVGRGGGKQIRAEIRSDHVRWLEPTDLTAAQQGYWNQMEELRVVLNRELFLGLFDLEAHLACFPAGAHYKAHLDRHRESEARLVSAVVYLNPDWTADDGGELRIYTDRETGVNGPHLDVVPGFGKLVLFLSADFWHEVLPSRRERHSLTGWFRRRVE
jgi:SM-20-related protein